jgi:hypothetical protein
MRISCVFLWTALALAMLGHAPFAARAEAPPEARLNALRDKSDLSQHTTGVIQQARAVAGRLAALPGAAPAEERARLSRLCLALVGLAEASAARDMERALFEAAARRLANVEAQLHSGEGSP